MHHFQPTLPPRLAVYGHNLVNKAGWRNYANCCCLPVRPQREGCAYQAGARGFNRDTFWPAGHFGREFPARIAKLGFKVNKTGTPFICASRRRTPSVCCIEPSADYCRLISGLSICLFRLRCPGSFWGVLQASGNGPLPKRRCGVASELEFSATQVPSTQVRGLYALSQDTPAASQYSTVEVHLPSVGQSGQLSQPNTAAISDGNDLDITLDEDDLLLPLNTGSGLGISMAAPAMRPETGSAVAPKPVDSNTTNDATDDWFGNEIAALRSRAGQA